MIKLINRVLWEMPRWLHTAINWLTNYRMVRASHGDKHTYNWVYWPYGIDEKGL
jgi:hypothetical protein